MASPASYLRLFRWSNLLIMALAQILFRYAVILPAMQSRGIEPRLGHPGFLLLVLATLLISAAAYAINDYFDLRIDRINKPQRIILGKAISRRKAILAHTLLSFAGTILGFILAWRIGYWPLALVFVAIPALLWLYSLRYKRRFLVGNLLVAFLSAFVILLVWIVEYRSMLPELALNQLIPQLTIFARVYAFFAFFTTLVREIIKDAEDIRGDAKAGCRTIPVVLGIPATRRLLLGMIALMFLLIGYGQLILFREGFQLLLGYLLLLVQVPVLGLLFQGFRASSQEEFKKMQNMLKFIMLTGILSMLLLSIYL